MTDLADLTDLVVKDAIREELEQCACKLCNTIVEALFLNNWGQVPSNTRIQQNIEQRAVSEILLDAFIAHIDMCVLHYQLLEQE